MRLITRLTVGFLIVQLLVVSFHEVRRLEQEMADFEHELDRTHLLVANVLVKSAAIVAPLEGFPAALATLERTAAEVQTRDLRIRWICVDGFEGEPPPLGCDEATDGRVHHVQKEIPDDGTRRFTVVPVTIGERILGAIEVSEAPDVEDRWASARLRHALILASMMIAASAAAAFILGLWLVARPTRALVEKARAIGRGELDRPLVLSGADEFGVLATEMNTMCERIREARETVARESAARAAMAEQLRHAGRLATVGQLASGLAHELGTPLNVVEARAGLLAEDSTLEDAPRASARVIVTCVEQMTRLIRQLLMFARQKQLDAGPVRVAHLCQTIVEILGTLAERRGIVLTHERGREELSVLADEVLLQQAVTNLVVNALQACDRGNTVRVHEGRAERAHPDGGPARPFAFIAVADSGPGIPDEARAHIFEPFFTTKPPGEGTGLGLAVAWGIIDEHGGWIDLESAPGKGSTFTVYLPAEPTP